MKTLDQTPDIAPELSDISVKLETQSKTKRPKRKSKTPYKYPLVEIIWDDASTDNGWEPVPEDLNAELVTTVGFLVRENATHLLIANSYDPNHTNGRIQIPIGMVLSRKVIL